MRTPHLRSCVCGNGRRRRGRRGDWKSPNSQWCCSSIRSRAMSSIPCSARWIAICRGSACSLGNRVKSPLCVLRNRGINRRWLNRTQRETPESESVRTEPEEPTYEPNGTVGSGPLRLTGEFESTEECVDALHPLKTESDADNADINETNQRPRVTPEELSMLLGGLTTDSAADDEEGETER